MIIYKDIFTKDEIISDSYNLLTVDDVVYEVEGKKVTKGAESYDTGANPSAEEQEEAIDEVSEQVIDIVDAFSLQRVQFNKKSYVAHMRPYLKHIKEYLKDKKANEETIKGFQTRAENYVKKILQNFKEYDFYTTTTDEPYKMIVLLNYREDGITPYFTLWKDGLFEEKV
ncbi:MAG: hypothetical protein M1840_006202 [Geoglossum simile]|nr:MAG: hypothetical protein M1840_006202 [Geoglossum simile]